MKDIKYKIKERIEYLKNIVFSNANEEILFLKSLLIEEGVGLEGSEREIELSLREYNTKVYIIAKNTITGIEGSIMSIGKDGVTIHRQSNDIGIKKHYNHKIIVH